jgi:hypothetical protein
MMPQEFIAFRKRLSWSLATLSRHISITPSRLADYDTGHTRGNGLGFDVASAASVVT